MLETELSQTDSTVATTTTDATVSSTTTTEAATAPVETATAPVETATTAATDTTNTASEVTNTAVGTAQTTTETVTESAQATTDAASATVETATTATTDATEAASELASAPVETAAQDVSATTEQISTTADAVTQTATDATQAVDNTVAAATESTAAATQQVRQSVEATVASANATAATATQSATQTVESSVAPMTGGAPPAGNIREVVQAGTGTDTLAPGTVPVAQPTEPVGSVFPAATEPVQAVVSPVEQLPITTRQPAEVLPAEVLSAPDATLTPTEPAAPIAEAFTGMEVAEILPIAGAVGLAAIGATAIVRGALQPSASIIFTNFRLAPCFVSASVQQSAAAATSVVSRLDVSGTVEKGFGAGAAFGSIRDGFLGRPPVAKDGGGLTDSKLLIQIGMLLGLVYLGFLTFWFRATRSRWNPRS